MPTKTQAVETPVPETPSLPVPSPLELSILRDWVGYTRVSLIRLDQLSSAYAEMFHDFVDVVDGIVNPEGA